MNHEYKVMTLEDIEDILTFEMARLPGEGIEKEMESWHALWRREALEHYAPLGWSFVSRAQGQLQGYVLAQPILFFKGWTQSLWVEHISATSQELETYLFEVAYRWARDKHFQKVYFHESLQFMNSVPWPIQQDGLIHSLSTTKM